MPEAMTSSVEPRTAPAIRTDLFRLTGVDCPSCAGHLTRALEPVPGVRAVRVDVLKSEVQVEVVEPGPSRGALVAAIARAGYGVRADDPAGPAVRPRGPLVAAAGSGVALAAAFVGRWLGWPEAALAVPFGAALAAGAWYVAPRGLRALARGSPDMHALMTIAAAGAALIGEWAEAASAMFLFAVARLLEEWAVGRARRAITALLDLAPREAVLIGLDGDRTVAVDQVAVGRRIRIRPGERVPLDGVVTAGSSSINESPITGEAMPVEKGPGDAVYAGTINLQGALEVRTTALARDTTLARILHLVEEAQASRAPVQTFVDRFARGYTPVVVGLAALVALLPPLFGLGAFTEWLYRALALLVIACPCALVISTPVTIVSALTGAARAGVLLKGGAQLEAMGQVTTVVFDKTGTLTEGRPAVTGIALLDGQSEEAVLRLAAGIERHSEHPVARAIVEEARARGLAIPAAADFEALPGVGARATIGGRRFAVGNRRLCEAAGACSEPLHRLLEAYEARGETAVLLLEERTPLAVLGIADRVRPDAARAVSDLRRTGIRRLMLLTGDGETAARVVAGAVGLPEWRARLLPEDKYRTVRELEQAGERVAVVGDGINDAPALAAATVGIAMGAAGTHVALETADVALMGDDLSRLAPLVRRSRRTLALVRQNIAFAIGVKALFLVLAVLGDATLWMAVLADMGASLAVVANGLRALPEPQA